MKNLKETSLFQASIEYHAEICDHIEEGEEISDEMCLHECNFTQGEDSEAIRIQIIGLRKEMKSIFSVVKFEMVWRTLLTILALMVFYECADFSFIRPYLKGLSLSVLALTCWAPSYLCALLAVFASSRWSPFPVLLTDILFVLASSWSAALILGEVGFGIHEVVLELPFSVMAATFGFLICHIYSIEHPYVWQSKMSFVIHLLIFLFHESPHSIGTSLYEHRIMQVVIAYLSYYIVMWMFYHLCRAESGEEIVSFKGEGEKSLCRWMYSWWWFIYLYGCALAQKRLFS